jgi:hypothetical protein
VPVRNIIGEPGQYELRCQYVAVRNIIGDPCGTAPYMEFLTEPMTKFVFNRKENFRELRWLIEEKGWLTFDLS